MNASIKDYSMNKITTLIVLLLAPLAALQAAVEPIPAFTTGARILFIGDSITEAWEH